MSFMGGRTYNSEGRVFFHWPFSFPSVNPSYAHCWSQCPGWAPQQGRRWGGFLMESGDNTAHGTQPDEGRWFFKWQHVHSWWWEENWVQGNATECSCFKARQAAVVPLTWWEKPQWDHEEQVSRAKGAGVGPKENWGIQRNYMIRFAF